MVCKKCGGKRCKQGDVDEYTFTRIYPRDAVSNALITSSSEMIECVL
jgi:hypothetical protein